MAVTIIMRVGIWGVLVGGVVDIVSTGVFGVPYTVYVMATYNLLHLPPNQVQSALMGTIYDHPALWVIGLLPGLAGSILGGYVAARIAKHDELINGALSAYLCMAGGVYEWISAKSPLPHPFPLYVQILGFAGSPALGLLGGWLRLAQKRSKRTSTAAAGN